MNNIEKQTYIENILLPNYLGSQHKNIRISIYDAKDGSIIFMTDYFAKMHGFNAPEEIKGKKIADIPNAQKHLNLVAKLEYIRQMVIESQMPVSYIVCGKLNDEFYANDVKHAPLFHPDGTVIATIVIGGDYHWFSRSEFALSHFKHVTKIPQDKQLELQKKINLTVRQHEILFLLLCGFSQQESAELLNIALRTTQTFI